VDVAYTSDDGAVIRCDPGCIPSVGDQSGALAVGFLVVERLVVGKGADRFSTWKVPVLRFT
jgi:hypothetical protein